MSWLRALARLTAILVFVLLMCAWLLASSLGVAVFNFLRGRGFWASTDAWRSDVFNRCSRFVLPLLGVRLHVRGSPPDAPFVLVSNHLSYLDILLLASRLRTVFIAKSEVRNWPLLGILCHLVGTQFIQREKKSDVLRVMEKISHILETGRGVVFFPEGTTSNGETVQPFRPALLEVPVRTGQPVSWASISYAVPVDGVSARDTVCWWGGMNFVGHLMRLLGLPRVDATLTFGEGVMVSADRKTLALRLKEAITRDFVPVT